MVGVDVACRTLVVVMPRTFYIRSLCADRIVCGCGCVCSACIRDHNINRGITLLRNMQQEGLEITSQPLTMLIHATARRGMEKQAQELLQQMRDLGLYIAPGLIEEVCACVTRGGCEVVGGASPVSVAVSPVSLLPLILVMAAVCYACVGRWSRLASPRRKSYGALRVPVARKRPARPPLPPLPMRAHNQPPPPPPAPPTPKLRQRPHPVSSHSTSRRPLAMRRPHLRHKPSPVVVLCLPRCSPPPLLPLISAPPNTRENTPALDVCQFRSF